jgi:hypothetical protein
MRISTAPRNRRRPANGKMGSNTSPYPKDEPAARPAPAHRHRNKQGRSQGTAEFRDVMLEIGVLAATVLLLGATVLVLRIKRAEDDEAGTGSSQ